MNKQIKHLITAGIIIASNATQQSSCAFEAPKAPRIKVLSAQTRAKMADIPLVTLESIPDFELTPAVANPNQSHHASEVHSCSIHAISPKKSPKKRKYPTQDIADLQHSEERPCKVARNLKLLSPVAMQQDTESLQKTLSDLHI